VQSNMSGPAAGRPLHISIGQVPLSLHILKSSLLDSARMRYDAFEVPAASSSLPVFLEPSSEGPGSAHFSHVLDDARMSLGSQAANFEGVRHEYALDSLLRILLTALLLPRRGFLLHAATVARDNRAYVFTGRSGAGKSTVASLSPEGTVFTDEISLLRAAPSHTQSPLDDRWDAYSTPFWGEFRAAGSNRRLPLAGVYSLCQAAEDRVERLTLKEAVRTLLPNVLFFSQEKAHHESLFKLLFDFAKVVPIYRLHFRRQSTFWGVVQG